MSWYDVIKNELHINEAFEMPVKLMECLKDKEARESLFLRVLANDSDLSKDTLSVSFQEQLGNRSELMQDFTPDAICRIIAGLTGSTSSIADICAGSGGLVIRTLNTNCDSNYLVEEKSKAAISVLLFNLAIRNVNATVIQCDVLTRKEEAVYKLTKGKNFSDIEVTETYEPTLVDKVITNPPYSLSWHPMTDERFEGYELAPKSKADYAFVLHGLSKLKDQGELLAILPHGVLFRGQTEGKIRKKLIDNNLINMVIRLPENMFLNTQIPTVILKLKKNRETEDVLFVDAGKECVKVGKHNDLTDEHIEKVIAVAKHRLTTNKYSRVVSVDEIRSNDYNLNIPRYVDTSEPEEKVDLYQAMKDYADIAREIHENEKSFFELLNQLISTSDSDEDFEKSKAILRKKIDEYEQLDICNF